LDEARGDGDLVHGYVVGMPDIETDCVTDLVNGLVVIA
jgi:hypothetical protein